VGVPRASNSCARSARRAVADRAAARAARNTGDNEVTVITRRAGTVRAAR
jgi:hypothetical protein